MTRSAFRSSLVLAALLALPFQVAGQLPSATPEQRAAGAQVASIDLGVDRLVVERGETISLEPRLLDADGNVVAGAVGLLLAQGGLTPSVIELSDIVVEVTGSQPTEGEIMLLVMVPEDQGGASDRRACAKWGACRSSSRTGQRRASSSRSSGTLRTSARRFV